jgi:hypothetical protein
MKYLSILLLTLISYVAFGQSVDDIINKHIAATGGEKWNTLNSCYSELSADMGGVKVPIKMYQEHLKAMRVEFVVQGMTGVQVVTDKSGWSLMPFMGQTKAEPTNEEQLKASRSQLDLRGQLVGYKAKGSTVEYLGEDEDEGVEVFKIKLVDSDKTETTYFIEKETYLLLKSSSKFVFQGKEMENVSKFSNYKMVDGLMMPYSVEGGGMGKMEVTKIDINSKIDPKLYEMPSDK